MFQRGNQIGEAGHLPLVDFNTFIAGVPSVKAEPMGAGLWLIRDATLDPLALPLGFVSVLDVGGETVLRFYEIKDSPDAGNMGRYYGESYPGGPTRGGRAAGRALPL